MGLIDIFPPAEHLATGPQLFLIVVYGYILFYSSKTISNGSEILLGIYGPGIVGGLLIPILGAVPDGIIILLSGMGDGSKEKIQEELSVGVGTLAGSTVMLLTVPWAVGVFLNRRQMDPTTGKAGRVKVEGKKHWQPMLPTRFSWTENCATTLKETPRWAKIMMFCSLTYLIVQVPAFIYDGSTPQGHETLRKYALAGFSVSIALFCGYLLLQFIDEDAQMIQQMKQAKETDFTKWLDSRELQKRYRSMGGTVDKVFAALDRDNDGFLDHKEIRRGLAVLGLKASEEETQTYLDMIDTNQDSSVSLEEFREFVQRFMSKADLSDEELNEVERRHAKYQATADAFREREDPGPPSAEVLAELEAFMQSSRQTELRLSLKTKERHQVHVWCNKQRHPKLSHFSEDVEGKTNQSDPAASDSVREMVIRKLPSTIVVTKRVVSNRNLPFWANVSDKVLAWVEEKPSERAGSITPLFKLADKEGKGALDQRQMHTFCADWGLQLNELAFQLLFFTTDTAEEATGARDRKLSKSEFRSFLERMTARSQEEIHELFPGKSKRGRQQQQQRKQESKVAVDEKSPLLGGGAAAASLDSLDLEAGTVRSRAGSYSSLFDEDEDEEEEVDPEMKHWTTNQKRNYAIFLLAVGAASVTIFSDPMVDTINAFAQNVGISAFYVSFIVTPLASNASEVISGLIFAGKKTNKGISLTFSAMYGGATMNATFCLAIFLGIVYFRDLSWNYSAEVITTLTVAFSVGIMGLRDTIVMWQAALVLLMYPGALLLTYLLEHVFGLP